MVRATASVVARMLDAGELGDPLPPERVLAQWLSVNRLTLRWAIDRLIAIGRLQRHQGSGVRIASTAGLHQFLNRSVIKPSPMAAASAPNHAAPALALIADDPPHRVGGWTWRAAMQIAGSAQQRGDRVVTLTAGECLHPSSSQSAAAHCLAEPSSRAWRGAVALSDRIDASTFERLLALPLPIVGLGRCQARSVWNVIDVDWSPALHDALDDLPNDSRGGVLILTSDDKLAVDRQRWCEALVCSLISRGFSADRLTIVSTCGGEGDAYLVVRRHLRRTKELPAAVLADDDLSAAGARRALDCCGRDGSHVFVLGCGGTRVSQYLRPRLPTLSPPLMQITQIVNDWLTGRDAGRRFALQMLSARYIRRHACAPTTAR